MQNQIHNLNNQVGNLLSGGPRTQVQANGPRSQVHSVGGEKIPRASGEDNQADQSHQPNKLPGGRGQRQGEEEKHPDN